MTRSFREIRTGKIDPRLPALNAVWSNPSAYEAERAEGQRKLTALFDAAMDKTPQSIAQRARWETME